jgi:hypothetical protein
MINLERMPINVPFHENLFSLNISIDMWTEDYYKLLELIGDTDDH